jgi:hypothetical protein
MKQGLLLGAVACLVFSAPGVADAKDKTQAAAAQQSGVTTQRRATTLKASFRGGERASVPSANRDYCPGQY